MKLEKSKAFKRTIGVFRIFVDYRRKTNSSQPIQHKSIPKYAITQTYYVGLDVHKETIAIAHALSWRMQNRLYNRCVRLKARGKTETKIIVAIARELSGFIWELQTKHSIRDREQGQL